MDKDFIVHFCWKYVFGFESNISVEELISVKNLARKEGRIGLCSLKVKRSFYKLHVVVKGFSYAEEENIYLVLRLHEM